MRHIPIAVAALVLLGAATLFAGPEEEVEGLAPLGIGGEHEAGPDQADAIAKGLAETPRRQVRVDAVFLRVDAARADEVLGAHRPDALGSVRAIPETLARRLIDLARGTGPVRPEPLPPLVLHDGQRGRLAASGHHSYLQDYQVEIGSPGSHLADAIVGRMTDGTGVVVLPHRTGEGLCLDVDAAWAEVIRPVPLFTTTLAAPENSPVTIELPELRLFQVGKQVELPAEGGFVLAGGGRAWDGATLRLVVLEVRATGR